MGSSGVGRGEEVWPVRHPMTRKRGLRERKIKRIHTELFVTLASAVEGLLLSMSRWKKSSNR